MSGEKNRNNNLYDEGYKDGKNGGFSDDLGQSMTRGGKTPFTDGKREASYNKGYDDGADDRHDDSDSHYSGGTSESSGGCFITTATLTSIGKPDDCEELNAFRQFRDNWLAKQKGGKELIAEYYKVAPSIVAAIESNNKKGTVYSRLWRESIYPCLGLIKQERYEEAKQVYMAVVTELKKRFIGK